MRTLFLPFLLLSFGLALMAGPLACDSGGGGDDGADDVTSAADEASQEAGETCEPLCDGKACGDDGCGGICGHCYTMEGAQNDDLCLADGTCTVCGCGEKKCGTDACGSPCGACTGLNVCTDAGQCELDVASCTDQGFHATATEAKLKQSEEGTYFRYTGSAEQNGETLELTFEMDNRLGLEGPMATGDYPVYFKDFSKGGLWLHGRIVAGDGSETWFTPAQGTIHIAAFGTEEGASFQATLEGVVLQQVVVDDSIAMPVTPGRLWCLDGASISAAVATTPSQCGTGTVGTDIGTTIANFQLQNCNGDWVDLYEVCGKQKALWIVATAGW